MTLPAIVEISVAESASSVVTGHAALRPRRIEVLRDEGGGDLFRLRETGAKIMAVGATQTLTRAMCGMTETGAKSARVRRGAKEARRE